MRLQRSDRLNLHKKGLLNETIDDQQGIRRKDSVLEISRKMSFAKFIEFRNVLGVNHKGRKLDHTLPMRANGSQCALYVAKYLCALSLEVILSNDPAVDVGQS